MRPPLTYLGGKIRLAPKLIELMPPHDHYVEPFCGSLAVLLAKEPARHETVNDLDGEVIAFWRVLREREDEFVRHCALTPHSRAEHQASYETPADLDELERARRVWVQRTKTGWRHYQNPADSTTSMPGYLAGYLRRMPPAEVPA